MKKYNCNNTLEYVHEAARMCRAFDKFDDCDGCPFAKKSCRIFDVTPEHIRCVQAWSDANPEITLTDKQVEIFKAMNLLGLKFIVQDRDGAVYAFAERPRKGCATWVGEGDYLKLKSKYHRTGIFDAISPLVEWSDTEPLNIEEALEQAEEANP